MPECERWDRDHIGGAVEAGTGHEKRAQLLRRLRQARAMQREFQKKTLKWQRK